MGYKERNAHVRIAQYESGYRVPKNNTLLEMAKILSINYIHFIDLITGCAEDIVLTLLWIDEDDRITIHLFQLICNPSKTNRYYDNDDRSAHPPVGMWLEYSLVNDFLREQCLRKEQSKNGESSEDKYF